MVGASLADLHESLRRELHRRMTAAGWTVDVAFDTSPGSVVVGAFRRRIADEFFATSEYLLASYPPDGGVLEVVGTVGVSYERAYRLWPLVCDREQPDLEIDLGELPGFLGPRTVRIEHFAAVGAAAAQLVEPVIDLAISWARPYASVDALVESSRQVHEDHLLSMEVEALALAAAGRHADARAALSRLRGSRDSYLLDGEYRRFRYRFSS